MNLKELFASFQQLNVLIIGDVMLDVYEWGKVERISPEAPVPVISLNKKENRLGGASNVAMNIQAMGANPIMCSVIGDDPEGADFLQVLKSLKISAEGIIKTSERVTTSKRRVIAGSQHLLRVDHEQDSPINEVIETTLLARIETLLPKCQVVIFEDYDKGCITPGIITKVSALCNSLKIPIAVDPKKRNFLAYKEVALFKPNLKELKEGTKLEFNADVDGALEYAVNQLHNQLSAQRYLITLSEKGVFIRSGEKSYRFSAHIREIADVSGAGDTVIAVAALCLAQNTSDVFLAELSNLAGGLVCEHVGAVPIQKDILMMEANKLQLIP